MIYPIYWCVPDASEKDVTKLQNRLKVVAKISNWIDRTVILAFVTQAFAQVMLQLAINSLTKSSVINFYLPKSLTKDWGVKQDN